jgi:hypothetical protein
VLVSHFSNPLHQCDTPLLQVIEERVVFPFLCGGQLMELRGQCGQLLSSSHRWVVLSHQLSFCVVDFVTVAQLQ